MSGVPSEEVVDTLVEVDGPTVITHREQPTVDSDVPRSSDYPDWKMEDTFVVTATIANDFYKGRRFESREDALAYYTGKYGKVLGAQYVPGRAFFRVLKPKTPAEGE